MRVPTASRTVRIGFKGIRTTTDESVLDWDYTPEMYNYRIQNGVLTGKLGLDAAKRFDAVLHGARHAYPALPSGVKVKGIFHYRRRHQGNYDDRLVIQTSEGALYYTAVFENDTWHEVEGYTLSGDGGAVSCNYGRKDVLLMSAPSSPCAVLDDGTVKTVTSAPRFSSVTVHNERIYGTLNGESNQLWFSDDFDPENWSVSGDEAGYISFSDECGDALAAVSFLGYLYVFREHGIYRLTAYGDQSEFSLKKLFTATGRIYKNTIALCGDRIMFLTDEGVFAFDGYTASPAVRDLPDIAFPTQCSAAYHDGAYWLACSLTGCDLVPIPYTNNVLVRYGIRDGDMSMLAAADILALCSVRSHTAADIVLSVKTGGEYKLASIGEYGTAFDTVFPKIYRTPFSDLSSPAIKTVRDVTLTTRYALKLTVFADDDSREFELPGSSAPQTVFVGMSGRKIGLQLRSESGVCYVTQPVVRLDITAQR